MDREFSQELRKRNSNVGEIKYGQITRPQDFIPWASDYQISSKNRLVMTEHVCMSLEILLVIDNYMYVLGNNF